jgi:ABC-type multidrug transport system fused ATPase/permease subunit
MQGEQRLLFLRLSRVENVSHVIVFDQGHIVETGMLEDLREQCVFFARLANLRFDD